jgi:hypothetical protein
MKKLLTLILPSLAFLSLSGVSAPVSASELTRGLHAVDRTVAHAIGAKKCRNVRDRYWSERHQRWVWTSTRVCRRIR